MKRYTFQQHLRESLKNPKFRVEWEKNEAQRRISGILIEKRLAQKMSQRSLAKRAKTTQAVISRIENMSANPSINLLKKIAAVFGSKLKISFS